MSAYSKGQVNCLRTCVRNASLKYMVTRQKFPDKAKDSMASVYTDVQRQCTNSAQILNFLFPPLTALKRKSKSWYLNNAAFLLLAF